jgi:mannose/fructose/N-acetylgalactosamine-specific phosphotransferase system component IIB
MVIFRVDDRLIHGQVVENWIPTFGISNVIVANDLISDDELRKNIMKFSIPSNVKIDFLKIDDLKGINFDEKKNYLVLFENLWDVWRAVLEGVKIDELNIGGIHYAKGRNFSFGKVMFLSDEEKEILKKLSSYGVSVYLQPIPQEKKVKVVEII